MKLTRLFLKVITITIVTCIPVFAQQVPSETWMGTYLGQSKVGYARFGIDKANFQGKAGYKLDSTTVNHLLFMGDTVEQKMETTAYLDKKFNPVYEIFKMSSGGHETIITAKFSEKEIIAEIESGGTKSLKKIPIPAGSKLVGDDTFFASTMQLKVGDHLTFKFFNPHTLSLDDILTDVLRKEELKFEDKVYQVYVIKSMTSLGEMICWQDENGELLRVTTVPDIIMLREPKETAILLDTTSASYVPPADLAVITSAATTTEIPYPRQVKHIKVRLSGLTDKSLIINDQRQKATSSDNVVEYEIKASGFDRTKVAALPISNAELQVYLADSPYVQPTNSEIAAAAKEIVGDEKNAFAIASKLRAWVHGNMQSQGNIGIVRSSVDVLHAKTGVCRDYAVLYTALARAAGIPTKLVSGLVYWKDGFYYHAWADSFVGDWIPIDPTLSTDFVDATHIKLAEGEATPMFSTVKSVGALKAEIVEFK